MAFSAAELQKRHGLEGAPDPFPALGNAPAPSPSVKKVSSNGASATPAPVDTSSEDAFPSLGTSAAPATTISKPAVSMWSTKPATIKASKGTAKPSGAGGLGRSGVPTAGSHPFAETFSLPTTDIETGKTMGEVLKKVSEQTGAIVESSTQMRTGLKTFHLRAADAKRLAYARKMIERGLSKSVTILVEVPITTLGTIIGPKGATLKGITDSTQCKIDIPRRDTLPTYEPAEGNESDDEHEEPQVAISVTGPSVACNDAKSKILALISHKTSQTSTSIKNIPSSYYPFIAGPKGSKARQLEEEFGDVKIHVPPPAVWKALEKQAQGEEDVIVDRDLSIKVRGDKEKVKLVIASITKRYEELTDSLREFKISIPKRQHRFLVGAAADDILDQTSCIVELPPVEDPSDLCVIRGPQPSLIPALTLVMDKANAIAVEMVDIVALHRPNTSDPLSHAKKVLRYLQRSSKLRSIAEAHEGVKVFPPFASAVASTGSVVVEIVSENKAEVAKAKDDVAAAVKAIVPSAIVTVEVDPLVHPLLIGKKGSKIAQFESANEVTIVFPPAADESSEVLLVYTGTASSLPTDKKAKEAKLKELLNAASAALSELAKEAADIKSETLDIEKKWHRFIIGQGGTVLNALIGEDHLVNVKVGSGSGSKSGAKTNGAAASTSDEDIVVVRGPSGEVDRVVAQIKQIVEDAKNDDIINGYTVEFSVDKKHVPHLVGSAGAAINKLRETLGVKINFDDEAEGKKGKKAVAHCSIVGRKEAVEEAKKRLEAQIEKLEDETTETVTIKRAIQPALIGSGGKYAIRLEEKYGVKLSFPRDGKDGAASSKPDDVTIRGGKKGVAAAKAELLEAAAFEAESRQSLSFTVPTKAVAQIVGKSGSTINGIKDETGAQIDIDKAPGDDGKTTVTVRGDKKAIAAAKAKVLEVVEQAGADTKMAADPRFLKYVDEHQDDYINRLAKAVAIPSVSGNLSYVKDVEDMADFLISQLNSLGVKTQRRPIGTHELEGKEVDLPPVVIGEIGNDPKKKTLLIYGHYDVQPALLEDGWIHPPFELTKDPEGTGKLYGRGSTDDKGPVLGWLNVLEAHKNLGLELPVNMKMCFEGMEENGSVNLDKFIESEKDKFFTGIDCMCISDNYWLDTKTPCLTYGLRGINYFEIRISGPGRDLHSGVFGGTVHEPMTDLISLMSKLVTPTGEILVPGVKELIAPVTADEQAKFEAIHFEMTDIHDAVGADVAISSDTVKTLMGRMRNPSLSLHGIEGAFSAPGSKTVIPCSIKGKFSIRLVPNLTVKGVTELVVKYLQDEFKKLGSKNTCEVVLTHGGEPWLADPNHYSYRAAHKATEAVYGQAPDYTREGGSIPVTLDFANILNLNVLLLPVGRGDDGAHSTNEKLDTDNYINGTKLLGSYMYELAAISKD